MEQRIITDDGGYLEIALQNHTVVHGIAHGGDGQLVGADDAGIGHMEHSGHVR